MYCFTPIERVADFQRWVLAECLQVIDGFIPEENYSDSFRPPGRGSFRFSGFDGAEGSFDGDS